MFTIKLQQPFLLSHFSNFARDSLPARRPPETTGCTTNLVLELEGNREGEERKREKERERERKREKERDRERERETNEASGQTDSALPWPLKKGHATLGHGCPTSQCSPGTYSSCWICEELLPSAEDGILTTIGVHLNEGNPEGDRPANSSRFSALWSFVSDVLLQHYQIAVRTSMAICETSAKFTFDLCPLDLSLRATQHEW